jgi:tight adherence protein C
VFTVQNIVVFGIGVLFLALFMVFYIAGFKYAGMFEVLTEKDYPLKEIYFVGYAILNVSQYDFKTKHDRQLRKELGVLYGEKYADYYMRVIYAQKITIALLLVVLAFPMYGIANDIMMLIVFLVLAAVAYYYFGTATESKIKKRSEQMLNDFSIVVSKLALLTNAGMIIREAWNEVAYTGDSPLYKEMQNAVIEMDNGVSEIDAFFNFGTRCVIPQIKKFSSTIAQGIVKGNSELTIMLQEQSKEVWGEKKQNVRRQGEKAASRLLIPVMIMFIGILIMIIVPIFTNIGF